MVHMQKERGDIGAARAISDLTIKGYAVFSPVVNEHLPFDLIAYKDGVSYRIQSKYSGSGAIRNSTSWTNKDGSHRKYYSEGDFDYYAIYLPEIDKVIYPSIKFGGCTISTTIHKNPTPFYWWEDFINFTDTAEKKNYEDFGVSLTENGWAKWSKDKEKPKQRKVIRPSKEVLAKLLWETPTSQLALQFEVSDKAIEKWAKSYGLTKPPRGYWSKLKNGKL